ncbi:metallophosphoesterase [Methylomonas sp. HYX-M1]|uniref:metallophosphoesterase n=1 Tax=Methylomonas sp. HYX-M1 TaxID=3139307 RepID=UPI00345BF35E
MATHTVLQITDLHLKTPRAATMLGIDTEAFFLQTLRHALDAHPRCDLLLLTGDLAQDPCQEVYLRIRQHLEKTGLPCLCLPGNHDDFELMQQNLSGGQIVCERTFQLGAWSIIVLHSQQADSQTGTLAQAELQFLRETLEHNAHRPTLIAVHHHCIATGSPWMDSMQIDNSAAFLQLLAEYPQVKLVTCGHVHQEFARKFGTISLFGTPSSCFQFAPQSHQYALDNLPPGYRLFSLVDDGTFATECRRVPLDMRDLDPKAPGY